MIRPRIMNGLWRPLVVAFVAILAAVGIPTPAGGQAGGAAAAGLESLFDTGLIFQDRNGDEVVDLSDFVAGLSWFFSGGEAPRVCLDTTDLEVTPTSSTSASRS